MRTIICIHIRAYTILKILKIWGLQPYALAWHEICVINNKGEEKED